MTNWEQRYDESSKGWLECLDYLSEKLPRESYLAVYEEVKKLFITERGKEAQ